MIRLIAKKQEKGRLFELLLKTVLARQGYGVIRSEIHQTGTEIDIKAKDNLSGGRIIIEAKAHQKPIDTPELKKFLTTIRVEKIKKRTDYGIFWSLSGINNTAREYFDYEVDSQIKKYVSIHDDTEFQKILVDLGLIADDNFINDRIKDLVKKNLLSRELVYYKNQWYFIQYCSESDKKTHFLILESFGKPVQDALAKEIRIAIPELNKLQLILFLIKDKILEFLITVESATLDEIITGIKETNVDVKSGLEELLSEKLIRIFNGQNRRYSINFGLETFLKICRQFLEKDRKLLFMKSLYLINSLNNIEIISYITTRFYLGNLSQEYKKTILRMISVSPSALHHCLFGDNTLARNLVQQLEQKIPHKIMKTNIRSLITDLCLWLITDYKSGIVLGLQNTKAMSVDIQLKMATLEELFFKVEISNTIMLATAGGSIKAGELVKAMNPEMFLETSNILVHFGRKKEAIDEINKALKFFKNEGDWVYAALVNKGLLLHETKKLDEARECYEKARKLFPDRDEIWLNYGLFLLDMKDVKKAKKAFRHALQLRPNEPKVTYALARVALLENDEDKCFKFLEDVLKKEKRFLTRINLDKDFEKIKKTKKYMELLKRLNLPKNIS